MHIMEGFLPPAHALGWSLAAVPFLAWGVHRVGRGLRDHPDRRLLLGVATAFSFLLSALKLPSVTGSCSHPTGVGLGALLFGPAAMVPVGFVVLLFQALLLAHGGLTTLGANVFSMAVVGPFAAYGVWRAATALGAGRSVSVFLGACLGDMATYLTTSAQIAWAFPDPVGGFAASLAKFVSIFGLTQVPLAMTEGLLTVLVVNAMVRYPLDEWGALPVLHRGARAKVVR
ncbi:energy-coupling factor ABC transporter permease [Hydrogenophaga sp.]|uniref:energy-coupling factor ABC transporter permease n=1 Tax=Hydrogenophaga sp. TaxID=1904254 RepID=UPI00391C9A0B